jgi:hypothetical protein
VIVFVSLHRDRKKAFESASVAAIPQAGSRLGMALLSFSIRPGDLAPGEYQCQVTVLDPSGCRAAFRVNPSCSCGNAGPGHSS